MSPTTHTIPARPYLLGCHQLGRAGIFYRGEMMVRNYGQRHCKRCNRTILHNLCPMTADMLEALREYRRDNGKAWKAKLCDEWANGKTIGLLQQVRNLIGPRDLYRISID
jgi:hypothetical protein